MFYSAYDKQTGRIMASGMNSTTKESCIKDIIDYVNSDSPKDKLECNEENFIACDFEIEEHEEPFEYMD